MASHETVIKFVFGAFYWPAWRFICNLKNGNRYFVYKLRNESSLELLRVILRIGGDSFDLSLLMLLFLLKRS